MNWVNNTVITFIVVVTNERVQQQQVYDSTLFTLVVFNFPRIVADAQAVWRMEAFPRLTAGNTVSARWA